MFSISLNHIVFLSLRIKFSLLNDYLLSACRKAELLGTTKSNRMNDCRGMEVFSSGILVLAGVSATSLFLGLPKKPIVCIFFVH